MLNILLVEDEDSHRELIQRAFEQIDIYLEHCATIHDAECYLAAAPAGSIDAVIVDWNLPDGQGMELLRRIPVDAPFLLMTSFGNESLAVEAMKAGAMDYIVKSPEEFRRMPVTVQRIRREWVNIQKRKHAEEALRFREEQLRALINNTDDPIWSIDTEYRLLAVNAAFQAVIQILVQQTAVLGDNVLEYFPETGHNRRSLWKEYYDHVLQTGNQVVVEHQTSLNGKIVDTELSFNPIVSISGSITGVVVFTRDVSERKRSERELHEREERLNAALLEKSRLLEELERQKTRTLQAVVEGQEHERSRIAKDLHDGVGQMLSVVKIGVSAVQEQLIGIVPEEAAHLHESIVLLDYAVQEVRSVSHQLMPVALKQLGLSAAIQDICSSVTASTAMTIDTELSALELRMDAVQELTLYRIVQELLNNTLKYGDAKRISIQALREESALLVMYEDDGRGFDLHANRVGIGLNNIMSRAAMLGGTVELHSTPGEGMAATIDIPIQTS